jgi:serine protease DegQ
VVDAARGLVITNHHVVENARAIAVGIGDRQVEAEFLGSDPRTDIAVLRVPARGLKQLPLGDSDKAQVGDYVVAIATRSRWGRPSRRESSADCAVRPKAGLATFRPTRRSTPAIPVAR